MKSLEVSVSFLEPYRIQPWKKKEERNQAEYLRGMGYVRVHRSKNTDKFALYLPGTLLRSALLSGLERLLALSGGVWEGQECCHAVFVPSATQSAFKRKRPSYFVSRKEFCQSREEACPLCLLAGRFDRVKAGEEGNSLKLEDFDVHFGNLFLPSKPEFEELEKVAACRRVNRVEQFTGKAHDYFEVWEVTDPALWHFVGKIAVKEDIYPRVKELLGAGLRMIERLAGALCVVKIEGTSLDFSISPSVSRQLPEELEEKVEELVRGVEGLDISRLRFLVDVFRELSRQKEELTLPSNSEHYIWDKITVHQISLKNWVKEIFKNHPEYWSSFCERAAKALYEAYENRRLRQEREEELPTATPLHFAEEKSPSERVLSIKTRRKEKEWIVVGRLIAKTPFFFGNELEGEGRLLRFKDRRFRLPRTALRGVLRRDLARTGLSACEVEIGLEEPCPCKVCNIMRWITLKDAVSEEACNFLPENRKRIRLNPFTGTVDEGALFDTELGPEGISFPFVLRYRGPKFPKELAGVLNWWSEGKAFLSGEAGTGKGRFQLKIEKVFCWDLTEKKNLQKYLEEWGFRGREDELLKLTDPESYGLKEVTLPEEKIPFPFEKVEIELKIISPFLVKDTLSPLFEASESPPDAVFFRKPVWKNGKIEWEWCFPGESLRGVLRTAVGRRKGVLAEDHEDCSCVLCELFGNVHETGKIMVEDAEVIAPLGERVLDHVALDRFLNGAREHYKFDFKPLIGTPEKPVVLRTSLWIKRELSSEAREALKEGLKDLASGLYTLGGNGGAGYGWVSELRILKGPEWLKVSVEKSKATPFSLSLEELPEAKELVLDKEKSYLPYLFLKPLPEVPREKNPPTHEKLVAELFTGVMEVELEVLTPLIIPDVRQAEEDPENPGHRIYPFFRVNGKPVIPGSTLRGCFRSLYEALTNSCFSVFDERKVLSWRMKPDEFNIFSDPNQVKKGSLKPYFLPGQVIKKNGKLYIKEMQALRLPVYDCKEELWKKKCSNKSSYYSHPTKAEQVFLKTAPIIRIVLKELKNNAPEIFRGKRKLEWLKLGLNAVDPLVIFTKIGKDVEKYAKKPQSVRGYLKFTGPNVVEVVREHPKHGCPLVPENWWECVHNDVECGKEITVISRKPEMPPKPVTRPRHIPHFICTDGERVYRMRKRCERVFVDIGKKAREYEIPLDTIRRYEYVLEKYRENWERNETPDVFRTCVPGNGCTLSEGDLVYFRPDGEKVKDIIPVCISRIADELPLIYRLPEELWPCVLTECPRKGFECETCVLEGCAEKTIFRLHEEGLCPACALFGTSIYKGRVRFSFAWAEEYSFLKEKVTLPRLESPRASWMFRRDLQDKVPGRKFYLHSKTAVKMALNKSHANQIQKTKNNGTFETMEKGKFVFRVWFENLRDWELGLILLVLSGLGETIKLGHARPLGFGSVKPRIRALFLYKVEKQEFSPLKDGTSFIEAGIKKLEEWFGKEALEHLATLRSFLTFQEDFWIEYPEKGFESYEKLKKKIEENREVLYNPISLEEK